jgi:hypothetical protein
LRNGVCAPQNTPADIVDRLNREINVGLADAELKARLAEMGAWTLPGSPADFGKLIADDCWVRSSVPISTAASTSSDFSFFWSGKISARAIREWSSIATWTNS